MLKKLGLKENESIDHPWINKAMESAQKKVEARNFDIRKTLIKFDDVMNDQRQVIFSQRLNILRKDDIKDIIENFIDEITNDIAKIKKEYNTSNDNKAYLAGIKYFIGGLIKDDDLIKISSYNDLKFVSEIKNFYLEKKDKQIKLIGLDQYNDLTKKIFLQILDFSWRSHLQYLEQLRQVIGLRSYGQKDPLSEFKNEAFTLFQNLLTKIKVDVIKFLLNMNLVISSEETKNEDVNKKVEAKSEKKVGRNDKCPCGSGKKYKHCCGSL